MKMLLAICLAVALAACSHVPTVRGTHPDNSEERYETVAALVDEEDGTSYCSGVFIGEEVYTAAHCVDGSFYVEVGSYFDYQAEGNVFTQTFRYTVRYLAVAQDIAVLRPVRDAPRHRRALLAHRNPNLGERVTAVGNPGVFSYHTTRGNVTQENRIGVRTRTGERPMRWFQVSNELIGGMSGGPIFNEEGEVLGLVSFTWYGTGGAVHPASLRRAADALLED